MVRIDFKSESGSAPRGDVAKPTERSRQSRERELAASGIARGAAPRVRKQACIIVDCLNCGHAAALAEARLPDYGLPENASLVLVTRRLTCVECGSRAVKAQRETMEIA